jgi:hypothetical protein
MEGTEKGHKYTYKEEFSLQEGNLKMGIFPDLVFEQPKRLRIFQKKIEKSCRAVDKDRSNLFIKVKRKLM